MTSTGQAIRSGNGAALRAERERRRTSLDAVARGTLVRMDFLELIEEDRLEDLPSGAYARGFIRAYATYLGLDPKPFITSYEKRCGQPAPELSRVVRRGVRVPPAAQKRAVKIAITSASFLIILLVMLGVFRSGDEPTSVPSVTTAANRSRATTAPVTTDAVVRLEVTDETWVEVTADGQPVFAQTMHKGEFKSFKGKSEVVLFIARAGAAQITANGRILGTPAEASYRGVFTPGTTTLPPHEPVQPAAPPPSSDPAEEESGQTQEAETSEEAVADAGPTG
jgi:cytoskeleton protein RodZ